MKLSRPCAPISYLGSSLLPNCPGSTSWCFGRRSPRLRVDSGTPPGPSPRGGCGPCSRRTSRDSSTGARAALTNFDGRLSEPHAKLAAEVLKDLYHFDFLALGDEAHERDLESALVRHITRFLLELAAGFVFVGRQHRIEVGGEESLGYLNTRDTSLLHDGGWKGDRRQLLLPVDDN